MRSRNTSQDNPFSHLLQVKEEAAVLGGTANELHWKPVFPTLSAPPVAESFEAEPAPSEELVSDTVSGVETVEGASTVEAPVEEEEEEDVFNRRHLSATPELTSDGRVLTLSAPETDKVYLVLDVPSFTTYADPVSVFHGGMLAASNISLAKLLAENPWLLDSREDGDFTTYGSRMRIRKQLRIPADPNTLIRACHVKDLL